MLEPEQPRRKKKERNVGYLFTVGRSVTWRAGWQPWHPSKGPLEPQGWRLDNVDDLDATAAAVVVSNADKYKKVPEERKKKNGWMDGQGRSRWTGRKRAWKTAAQNHPIQSRLNHEPTTDPGFPHLFSFHGIKRKISYWAPKNHWATPLDKEMEKLACCCCCC